MNKKILLITLPALLVLIYMFSAMHSLHQVHKALYYNDTQLSKKYIEWNELKNNFKNVFKANLIDKMINDKDVMKLGDLGFAMIEKVEKSWDLIIDSYFTPEGINLFLKKIINKNEILIKSLCFKLSIDIKLIAAKLIKAYATPSALTQINKFVHIKIKKR